MYKWRSEEGIVARTEMFVSISKLAPGIWILKNWLLKTALVYTKKQIIQTNCIPHYKALSVKRSKFNLYLKENYQHFIETDKSESLTNLFLLYKEQAYTTRTTITKPWKLSCCKISRKKHVRQFVHWNVWFPKQDGNEKLKWKSDSQIKPSALI